MKKAAPFYFGGLAGGMVLGCLFVLMLEAALGLPFVGELKWFFVTFYRLDFYEGSNVPACAFILLSCLSTYVVSRNLNRLLLIALVAVAVAIGTAVHYSHPPQELTFLKIGPRLSPGTVLLLYTIIGSLFVGSGALSGRLMVRFGEEKFHAKRA